MCVPSELDAWLAPPSIVVAEEAIGAEYDDEGQGDVAELARAMYASMAWFQAHTEHVVRTRVDARATLARSIATGEAAPKKKSMGAVPVAQMPGTERLEAIRASFAFFTERLQDFQRDFRQEIFHAALPKIYGRADWAAHSRAILEYWNVPKWHQIAALVTARQNGKSTTLSEVLAAIAAHAPGLKIIVCSTGERASTLLKAGILKYLAQVPRARVKVSGEEILVTVVDKHGNTFVNVIKCLPDNVKTLRGQQADMVILEEAGHISSRTLLEFALQLLPVDNCVVLAITSPGPRGAFKELLDLEVTPGEPAIKKLVISSMCLECAKTRQKVCPHVPDRTPYWKKTGRGSEILNALMAQREGDTYRREALGIDTDSGSVPAFPTAVIKALAVAPRYTFEELESPELAFLAWDMSAGGKESDEAFAVCTFVKVGESYQMVVCVLLLSFFHRSSLKQGIVVGASSSVPVGIPVGGIPQATKTATDCTRCAGLAQRRCVSSSSPARCAPRGVKASRLRSTENAISVSTSVRQPRLRCTMCSCTAGICCIACSMWYRSAMRASVRSSSDSALRRRSTSRERSARSSVGTPISA